MSLVGRFAATRGGWSRALSKPGLRHDWSRAPSQASTGAEALRSWMGYAALKRRSSTLQLRPKSKTPL